MLLALAAYATYVVNAAQFLLKLRAARRDERRLARRRRRRAGCPSERAAALAGRRPTAAAPMRPVLRERGQREVFCGLTGIIWLHRKIQDAFFLVVGSRTCAHLIQSAAGVMIFAEPRFATAIIDERDLAGLADANDELDRVVGQLLARRPDIRLLFLVGSCPSEVIKLDLSRAAQRLTAALRPGRARAELFRQRHRDDLHPGRGCLPRRAGARACRRGRDAPGAAGRRRAGRRGRGPVRAGCSPRIGIGPVALPAAAPRRPSCRRSGRNTRIAAGPALPGRHRARARGARRARRSAAPFPLGAEGTTALAAGRRRRLRRRRRALRRGHRAPATRARRSALARHREHARAAAAHLLLPRHPARDPARALPGPRAAACSRSRSARPTCTASISAAELGAAAAGTRLIARARTSTASSTAAAPRGPTSTVCGLGLANPLEAEGFATKWSIELVFTPIQGYEQAGDLAELFARPLVRRARLEV